MTLVVCRACLDTAVSEFERTRYKLGCMLFIVDNNDDDTDDGDQSEEEAVRGYERAVQPAFPDVKLLTKIHMLLPLSVLRG
jgi:hypothetical protein